MGAFAFQCIDLLNDPYGTQYFKPIDEALVFGVERFPSIHSWRIDIARYLAFADRYIDRAIARDDSILYDYPRDYQVCRIFLEASRGEWQSIKSHLARAKLPTQHRAELRVEYLRAAITLRQCERCITAAQAGDVVAVGFLVLDADAMLQNDRWESDTAYEAYEVRQRARDAARAGHAAHLGNKQKARDWYAAHNSMTKDAAAQRMHDERIVAASFRTIRGYLNGQ